MTMKNVFYCHVCDSMVMENNKLATNCVHVVSNVLYGTLLHSSLFWYSYTARPTTCHVLLW